ncbi:hypothetical protein PUN28_001775 [Cardiocondyla obscurior]|uniref:Uncharacterized protein n=1 Tax=Cardiocondyla obscurior TaxID=286306 RepID=A0AAW2GR55_9HYME
MKRKKRSGRIRRCILHVAVIWVKDTLITWDVLIHTGNVACRGREDEKRSNTIREGKGGSEGGRIYARNGGDCWVARAVSRSRSVTPIFIRYIIYVDPLKKYFLYYKLQFRYFKINSNNAREEITNDGKIIRIAFPLKVIPQLCFFQLNSCYSLVILHNICYNLTFYFNFCSIPFYFLLDNTIKLKIILALLQLLFP